MSDVSPCRWPMSHRNRHGVDSCGCVCLLEKGHAGRHQCSREVPVERLFEVLGRRDA